MSNHSDSDDMGSIPAIPDARKVPLLLCRERFNEASLAGLFYIGSGMVGSDAAHAT